MIFSAKPIATAVTVGFLLASVFGQNTGDEAAVKQLKTNWGNIQNSLKKIAENRKSNGVRDESAKMSEALKTLDNEYSSVVDSSNIDKKKITKLINKISNVSRASQMVSQAVSKIGNFQKKYSSYSDTDAYKLYLSEFNNTLTNSENLLVDAVNGENVSYSSSRWEMPFESLLFSYFRSLETDANLEKTYSYLPADHPDLVEFKNFSVKYRNILLEAANEIKPTVDHEKNHVMANGYVGCGAVYNLRLTLLSNLNSVEMDRKRFIKYQNDPAFILCLDKLKELETAIKQLINSETDSSDFQEKKAQISKMEQSLNVVREALNRQGSLFNKRENFIEKMNKYPVLKNTDMLKRFDEIYEKYKKESDELSKEKKNRDRIRLIEIEGNLKILDEEINILTQSLKMEADLLVKMEKVKEFKNVKSLQPLCSQFDNKLKDLRNKIDEYQNSRRMQIKIDKNIELLELKSSMNEDITQDRESEIDTIEDNLDELVDQIVDKAEEVRNSDQIEKKQRASDRIPLNPKIE